MRTVSLGSMVQTLDGMRDTSDLTLWENDFLHSIVERSGGGKDTTKLSDKQVETIEKIYRKHFA